MLFVNEFSRDLSLGQFLEGSPILLRPQDPGYYGGDTFIGYTWLGQLRELYHAE